eukprot:5578596-Prymnesium_polylepis.1
MKRRTLSWPKRFQTYMCNTHTRITNRGLKIHEYRITQAAGSGVVRRVAPSQCCGVAHSAAAVWSEQGTARAPTASCVAPCSIFDLVSSL